MCVFVFRKIIVFFVFACFAVFDKCHPMYPLSLGNIAGRSFHETTKECASMQYNNVHMFTILALSKETKNVFKGLFAEQFEHLSDEQKKQYPAAFKNTYPNIVTNDEYSTFLNTKIKAQTNRSLSEIILDDDFELLSESEIKNPEYRNDLLQQHIFDQMAKNNNTTINEHTSLVCYLNIAASANFPCNCLRNDEQPQHECEISCKFYKLMIYKRWLYYMMALMAQAEYNDVYFLPKNIEWSKEQGTYVFKEGVDPNVSNNFIGYDGVIEAFNKLIHMNIPHELEP